LTIVGNDSTLSPALDVAIAEALMPVENALDLFG
jgi:hypothetical protein